MAVRVREAHVQLLVRQQVPAEHVRHDEGVVVFVVEYVGKEDVFAAVAVAAAAAARPGRYGLVRAGHVAWVGGIVGRVVRLAGVEVEGEVGWGCESAGAQDGEGGEGGEGEVHGVFVCGMVADVWVKAGFGG